MNSFEGSEPRQVGLKPRNCRHLANLPLCVVDGIGTTIYSYSAAGQLLTEDGPFASDTVTNTYSSRLRVALD